MYSIINNDFNFVINELTYPLRNNQLHLAMNIALSLNHKPDPGSIHKDPHHIYHIPLLLLLAQILDNFMKKGKIFLIEVILDPVH